MIHPNLLSKRITALLIASLVFAGAALAQSAGTKKSYSLPAGDAAATLKQFSEQSGEQIVYPADNVRGVQTKAVSGELTARAALEKMLAGTGLTVVTDEKTGAFAVRAPAAAPIEKNVAGRDAEPSATRSARVPTTAEVTKPATASGDDSTVRMSPFQVNTDDDQGYLATHSLSGTRLNSKLEDLAASISVVTKQQLLDTASVDINDVFKYELGTEGTSQFTSFSVDRNVVTDGVSTDPANANRVRGLTSANIAVNGFKTSLPFDTYDIDALEISRGPNSTVFGLSNTGGGVNVRKAKANLSRPVTSFTTRGDSYDGYRGSFDINRPILKDKLAVRVLGLYNETGYLRKPSQDTTRRLELAVTAHPFKNTTVYGSFESYRNFNSRPNSLTPRDTITDWVNNGKPTWDPINQTVNFRDGRPSITGVTTTLEATLLPYSIAVSDSTFQQSPSSYIEGNGALGLFTINRLPAATGTGPNNVSGTGRLLQNGTFYIHNSTTYPLYNPAEISNKSLYDWTSVNLSAPNFANIRGETSSAEIEQTIINTPRNQLALQGAWLYERIGTFDRRFLGNGGAALQTFVDINEKLLDGSPNPYLLRPYIGGAAPSFKKGFNQNENYRANLAYQLDLSKESNFLHWIGKHQFTGYGEYRTTHSASLAYQDTISSNNTWFANPVATRNSTTFRTYPRYYVGDANGQNVDYAPAGTGSTPYTYPLRYYNGVTQQWVTEPVTYDEYYDGNRPNKSLLSSYGEVWQGFLLDGRIIPLASYRKDVYRTRDGNSAINPTVATNGYYDISPITSYGASDWVYNRGPTTSQGIVVKPLKWLDLSYSQSSAFSPGSQTFDVNGNPLPDPYGKTKDYGFSLNLFHGKLYVVAKQYETADIGRSTSDLNTIVQRVLRMDRRTASGDPGLTDFLQAQLPLAHPDWTQAQIDAETQRLSGVDPVYIRSHINKTHGDASNSYSHGQEIEITYNPTRYWTLKSTLSRSLPINGILSPMVQSYIDSRMATWTSVVDPLNPASVWWTTKGANGTVPRDFYINNVVAPLKLAIALQGKRRSQTSEYHASFLTNYKLAGITDNKWLKLLDVGGSARWVDKAAIGYLGAAPDADGILREYDPNKPVWQNGHTTLDVNAGYNLRFYNDRIRARVQLNVNNVLENGRLQPVAVNPDGKAWAFRIIDPRQFILSVKFDL